MKTQEGVSYFFLTRSENDMSEEWAFLRLPYYRYTNEHFVHLE